MSLWFYCVKHGKFSLYEKYPELNESQILELAKKSQKETCILCGDYSTPCRCRKSNELQNSQKELED